MYTKGKTMQQIQKEQHEDNLGAFPNIAEVRLKGDRATHKEKDVAALVYLPVLQGCSFENLPRCNKTGSSSGV